MRIREVYIASDHAGFKLKQAVMEWLDSQGVSYTDFGPFEGNQSVDYPDYAEKVGKAIRQQRDCYGILICGSGIGISIAANKINGIRAALCSEPVSAELSRLHNNANVLCMAGRMIGITMAQNIVSTFLKTSFEGVDTRDVYKKFMCWRINHNEIRTFEFRGSGNRKSSSGRT